MVTQKIHATYTETYDLNTAIGEMSILGIHTPQADSLKRMFKGFFAQYKKYRILGCNFSMQCASQMSLDPLQLGFEGGVADPRDILNPILFKACTGESLNLLLNMAYNKGLNVSNAPASDNRTGSLNQVITEDSNDLRAYYALLADDSFRREHPMKGLVVSGLKPMVHKVVTTQPFRWTGTGGDSIPGRPYLMGGQAPEYFGGISGSGGVSTLTNSSVFVSNGITPMPALDTAVEQNVNFAKNSTEENVSLPANWFINNVPRVYMGVIVLPPSILVRLFYRLTMVWHIEFYDFRPAFELGTIGNNMLVGSNDQSDSFADSMARCEGLTYFNLYHTPVSEALTMEMSSFDANGLAEVETVNESAR